jgi:hypothetical protein
MGRGATGSLLTSHEAHRPHHPQVRGNDGFAELVGDGASITGILPQLGVLAAYAAVLLALATWRLHRVLLHNQLGRNRNWRARSRMTTFGANRPGVSP